MAAVAAFTDPGAGYFMTDTVISGRPCHLIISNLDELVIAGVGATGQPQGTKTVPTDKDLLVFANRLTIYGKIHVPGGRIELYTKRLSVVSGSQPELSAEPEPRPRTLPEVAGGGVLPGTRPTLKSEMNRLPISAQAFLERGARSCRRILRFAISRPIHFRKGSPKNRKSPDPDR